VFHATLALAADHFVGVTKRSSSEYGLVYRSVDHKWLRELCEDVRKPTPPKKLMPHIPPNGFGPNIVAFAAAVVELQEKRNAADYDPMIRVKTSDALLAIRTARAAVSRFGRASAARKHAFLALLLFAPRR
jgi:hypothetical protein